MPYKYVVPWVDKRGSHARFFKKIERALKFSKRWSPPIHIYKLVKLTKKQKDLQKGFKWWQWRD